MTHANSEVIRNACELISVQDFTGAAALIESAYPFRPDAKSSRAYTPRAMTKVFKRDGFIDRYKGYRLIFPPALRLLSHYIPKEFPYHKNGKMSVGHIAYWETFPTIDHIVPVARGGADNESNWACCSMLTNSIKSNWTLEQLGWHLQPEGNSEEWDGLLGWFVEQVQRDRSLLENNYIKTWYAAALAVSNAT